MAQVIQTTMISGREHEWHLTQMETSIAHLLNKIRAHSKLDDGERDGIPNLLDGATHEVLQPDAPVDGANQPLLLIMMDPQLQKPGSKALQSEVFRLSNELRAAGHRVVHKCLAPEITREVAEENERTVLAAGHLFCNLVTEARTTLTDGKVNPDFVRLTLGAARLAAKDRYGDRLDAAEENYTRRGMAEFFNVTAVRECLFNVFAANTILDQWFQQQLQQKAGETDVAYADRLQKATTKLLILDRAIKHATATVHGPKG